MWRIMFACLATFIITLLILFFIWASTVISWKVIVGVAIGSFLLTFFGDGRKRNES